MLQSKAERGVEMSFAQNLKQIRTERNMTQEELAKLLNISRPTVAGYEAKNKQPDYDKLLQIADIFEVSTDYLLGRSLSAKSNKHMEYLTQDEHKTIADYRLLSEENQIRISERVEMLLSNQKSCN